MNTEQLQLFDEYPPGSGKTRLYKHTFDYIYSQWQKWEADPANAGKGKVSNHWYGKVVGNTVVNVHDDLENRHILMLIIHEGGTVFTHTPAPDFAEYKDYAYDYGYGKTHKTR